MAKLMGLGSGNNKLVTNYKELYLAASSNTGNLLFNYALELLIELDGTDIRWSTPAEIINREGHALLLPMANNIGQHMDLGKSGPKLAGVDVHVTVMGLGAQFPLGASFDNAFKTIPISSKNWLRELCSKSEIANVSVRGELTHRVFESLGLGDKAVVLGCPSNFLSSDKQLGITLANKIKKLTVNSLKNSIAVAAGNPAIVNLVHLEQALIGLVTKYGGRYYVQHPQSLICLAEQWLEDIPSEDVELVRERFFPDYDLDEMNRWLRQHASTYVSIPQWYCDISKAELTVGTRFHGTQIAHQAGVPSVCFHIDSRTKELCETMMVPNMSAKDYQQNPRVERVIELLKSWDWEAYDQNRMKLAKQTLHFIENNGLTPSQHLLKLVS